MTPSNSGFSNLANKPEVTAYRMTRIDRGKLLPGQVINNVDLRLRQTGPAEIIN